MLINILFSLLLLNNHPIHVSVSDIEYNPRTGNLEIVHKIFIDDLEAHLEEMHQEKLRLGTEKQHRNAETFIQKYIEERFHLSLNATPFQPSFVGWESDLEAVWIYQEITGLPTQVSSLEIKQSVLLAFYFDQKNLVHFEFKDQKKSFILSRKNQQENATF